jgi:uncharacterized membrane protein
MAFSTNAVFRARNTVDDHSASKRNGEHMIFLSSILFGFIGGLRSMLAPAFVSWAARLGVIHVDHTPLAFIGYRYTCIVFTVLAVGELVVDKLPSTPSRKAFGPFAARIVVGGLCGATIGASVHSPVMPATLGALGAVAGTLGGSAARVRLAALFKCDVFGAACEDAFALATGFVALNLLR